MSAREFTSKEFRQIEAWRKQGVPWERIAERLHTHYRKVRSSVDPEYAARRQSFVQASRAKRTQRDKSAYTAIRSAEGDAMFNNVRNTDVPNVVLLERERAHLIERSLTQVLCGDPLPGRSALDRLRAMDGA